MKITYIVDKEDIRSMIEIIQFLDNKLKQIYDKEGEYCDIDDQIENKLYNYTAELYKQVCTLGKSNIENIKLIYE